MSLPIPVLPTHLLTDRFGRYHNYLRISVTDRCNLRCVYCMPHTGMTFLSRTELLTDDEILRIARVFVSMGISKIRITGGEPLVREGLDTLLRQLANLPRLRTLAMTTNGMLLKDYALLLKDAGVQALNISLDSMKRDRFFSLTKRDSLYQVLSGIDAALEAGFEVLKLNVVVIAGRNDDEVMDFVEFVKNKPMNVRFIEYMPFKDNGWTAQKTIPFVVLKQTIETRYDLLPLTSEPSAVAKDFQLAGYPGSVSFITSMTDSFCGTCNRLRLTSDGYIKSCLFHPAEVGLREQLRQGITDEMLVELIHRAVLQKQEAHVPMAVLSDVDNRPMIAIGG